jgi:hypothetical protein
MNRLFKVAPLLDQIDGQITRVTADGAYDGAPTYQTIATYGDGVEVVIPPRSTAIPSVALPFEGSSSISVQTDGSLWVQTTVSAH